jgi:hypothetical protein
LIVEPACDETEQLIVHVPFDDAGHETTSAVWPYSADLLVRVGYSVLEPSSTRR